MPKYRKINRASAGFTQPRHSGRMGRKPAGHFPRSFRKGRSMKRV
jgi:hypothetical protein